jgi:hypothetical protein
MTTDATSDVVSTLQAMIDADGFELSAHDVESGLVDLVVTAKPGACADCLVPKPVMIEIANAHFAVAGRQVRRLQYPTD